MKRFIGLSLVVLAAALGAIVAAPRLDPMCLAQKLIHAAHDDRPGWGCVAYAAARGDTRVVHGMLAAGVAVNKRTGDGATPLLLAAHHGRLAMVELLLTHGARINAHNIHGATPLHVAARYDHAAVVRHLAHAGAHMNARDRRGRTPLLLTAAQAWHHHSAIARILVRAGAAITQADYRGNTPLMAAARSGHVPVMRYLLAQGATIEHRNAHGATALFLAVQNAHLNAARVLLNHGANADIHVDGRAALQVALAHGQTQMANLLHASGASHYIRYAVAQHLHEGRHWLRNDKPKRAIAAFSAVIALQPDNAHAFVLRAQAYSRQQQWRSARADLVRAAHITPPDIATLLLLARAYARTGANQQAVDTLRQVLALAPDNATARKRLSRLQHALASNRNAHDP